VARGESRSMKPLALDTPMHVEQCWIAGLLQERYGPAIAQRIMALDHIQGLDREVKMLPRVR
jgi:hypothetical protein